MAGCCVLIFCIYLTYNFFIIKNFASYPWYHAENNDSDAFYAAQTLGIINDGFLKCTIHPGATISTVHGTIYKLLSKINDSFRALTTLSEVGNLDDGFQVLNTATQISRISSLFIAYIFSALLLAVIYQFTKDLIISFLFTFYVVTSHTFLFHSTVVRPEALSLFFFFFAVLIFLNKICKENISLISFFLGFLFIGFFLGFSVFSKIQIGPLIVFFIGLVSLYLFWVAGKGNFITGKIKNIWFICCLASLMNIVLTPWWTLKRPGFLTSEFLDKIANNDFGRLYGPAPESFSLMVFIILLIFTITSFLFFVVDRKQLLKGLTSRSLPILFAVNVLNLGIISSVYLILLPVSASFGSYTNNTNHLVYSTITNVLYAGFLDADIDIWLSFNRILAMHNWTSQLLGVNVVFIAFLAFLFCIIRLFFQSSNTKISYLFIIFIFLIGIFIDFFSTMRLTPWSPGYLFFHYALYSIFIYSIGLAKLSSLELRNNEQIGSSKRYTRAFRLIALCLLLTHVILVSHELYKQPRESGKSSEKEYKNKQYMITRALATPFWEIIEAAINTKKKANNEESS
jgi:hypothetical protein